MAKKKQISMKNSSDRCAFAGAHAAVGRILLTQHDRKIQRVLTALKDLLTPKIAPMRPVGFQLKNSR